MGGQRSESGLPQPLRAGAALAALAVVVMVVASAVSTYRDEVSGKRPSRETTAAPTGSAVQTQNAGGDQSGGQQPEEGRDTGAEGVAVVVLTDGLNLRERPSTSARVIKQLRSGQRLLLVERGEGWYHVRDIDGSDGWVAAGGSFTRIED